jgi:hypothetical protein
MPNAQQARTPAPPEAAHDPIAVAALIAELPELEAKYLAAKNAAEEANKALDSVQQRIDAAIATLKHKAPMGTSWNNGLRIGNLNLDIDRLAKMIEDQQRRDAAYVSGQQIKQIKPFIPPSLGGGGYTP